ncbi:MAG: PadR family transcriptional regulator [Saccharofermentanales bacterium]
MTFNSNAILLDAIVLAVVTRDGTYGYKITQDVRQAIEISESTLYPVLRRLEKDNCLETYDQEFAGRNRRYYKITERGKQLLKQYLIEWEDYKKRIDQVFQGGDIDEQI